MSSKAIDRRMQVGRHKVEEKNVIKVNNIAEGIDIIKDDKKKLAIPSHEQTALVVGVEPSTVQKVRTILDAKNESLEQEVASGKKSIHAASEGIKKSKLKDRPITAQRNIGLRKFEKGLAKVIDDAINAVVEIQQIKQVTRELLSKIKVRGIHNEDIRD